MKKRIAAALCAALVLLAGCAAERGGRGEYLIYCRADLDAAGGGDAVYALAANVSGENDARIASELVRRIIDAEAPGCESPLPAGTRLLSVTIEDGTATVDLSGGYAALSGVELTIADACITLTLCQLPTVERVDILCQGAPLPYRERPAMTAGGVLLSSMDEEVRTLRVRLFFADGESGDLTSESRTIQLYEGQTKAQGVLDALLEGPESAALEAVLPEGVQVRAVRVENGVCYVTLSEDFLENIPQSMHQQENVVYSLVRSLCSVSDIQAVQLSVEGSTAGYYGGVDISAPLS